MKKLSLLFFMTVSSYLLAQNQVTLLSKEDIGKDAIEKTWYQNGQLEFEGSYSYGKKHGTHRWWYENGQLEFEEYYKYGKKHGFFKGWWKNGQLDYEGHFKHNQRDGIWRAYYENGQLRQPVLITQNDEVIGEIPPPGPNTKSQLDSLGTIDCYK